MHHLTTNGILILYKADSRLLSNIINIIIIQYTL